MQTYYHATSIECAVGILGDEKIRKSIDGGVYLCKTAKDAVKFAAFCTSNIVVFEVRVDESKVEESFDHNKEFFGCDAYIYFGDIPLSQVTSTTFWEI